MKVTKEYLRSIIKEAIEEVAGSGGSKFEIVGLQRGSDLRVIAVRIKGKDVEIAFHKDGGSPLVSHQVFFDLDAEQQAEVMRMARKAAGVRGGVEDYSQDEIDKMMSGGKVSSFKDELEEAESKEAIGYDAEVGGYHVHFNEKTGAISTITDKSNKKVSMKDIPEHIKAKINARIREVTKKHGGK